MTQSTVHPSTVAISIDAVLLTCDQPVSTLDNLTRLASKPGVQSTLIISKADGSIIRSTGLLSSSPSPSSMSSLPNSVSGTIAADRVPERDLVNDVQDGVGNYGDEREGGAQTAEDVAKMVHSFVSAAGGLVEGLNKGDEVKLLRLRTKKNELVIVPGSFCSPRSTQRQCGSVYIGEPLSSSRIRHTNTTLDRRQVPAGCYTRYSPCMRRIWAWSMW